MNINAPFAMTCRRRLHHTKRRRRQPMAAAFAMLLFACCWDYDRHRRQRYNPSAFPILRRDQAPRNHHLSSYFSPDACFFGFPPRSARRNNGCESSRSRSTHYSRTSISASSIPSSSANPQIILNGDGRNDDDDHGSADEHIKNDDNDDDDDSAMMMISRRTKNGGFAHTEASRAKISAANAGKVPWNKGVSRSDETKRKIAEGVQRRNHENLLRKLAAMNMTEAEYHANLEQKAAEKRARMAARKTPNGGYALTDETKQKISAILKQRFADGTIQRAPRRPESIRRGFTHTEETRRKISDTLKAKWANDEKYRDNMLRQASSAASGHNHTAVNKRISATLRAKWQDPVFREQMLEKLHKRHGREWSEERRQKISDGVKARWQDEEYRLRVTAGRRPPKIRALVPRQPLPRMVAVAPKTSSSSSSSYSTTTLPPLSQRTIVAPPQQPRQQQQPRSPPRSPQQRMVSSSSSSSESSSTKPLLLEPLAPRTTTTTSTTFSPADAAVDMDLPHGGSGGTKTVGGLFQTSSSSSSSAASVVVPRTKPVHNGVHFPPADFSIDEDDVEEEEEDEEFDTAEDFEAHLGKKASTTTRGKSSSSSSSSSHTNNNPLKQGPTKVPRSDEIFLADDVRSDLYEMLFKDDDDDDVPLDEFDPYGLENH